MRLATKETLDSSKNSAEARKASDEIQQILHNARKGKKKNQFITDISYYFCTFAPKFEH